MQRINSLAEVYIHRIWILYLNDFFFKACCACNTTVMYPMYPLSERHICNWARPEPDDSWKLLCKHDDARWGIVESQSYLLFCVRCAWCCGVLCSVFVKVFPHAVCSHLHICRYILAPGSALARLTCPLCELFITIETGSTARHHVRLIQWRGHCYIASEARHHWWYMHTLTFPFTFLQSLCTRISVMLSMKNHDVRILLKGVL